MIKVRLGMVGGGQGVFIGVIYWIVVCIDGKFDLVVGVLSFNLDCVVVSVVELGIECFYSSYEEMVVVEVVCEDGIQVVVIVILNYMYVGLVIVFLNVGIMVICDKFFVVIFEQVV